MRGIPWQDFCRSLRLLVPNTGQWSWLLSKHAIKAHVWFSEVLLFCSICELLNEGPIWGQSEIAKVSKLEGAWLILWSNRAGEDGEEEEEGAACVQCVLWAFPSVSESAEATLLWHSQGRLEIQQIMHPEASSLWSATKLNIIVFINNRSKIYFDFCWWETLCRGPMSLLRQQEANSSVVSVTRQTSESLGPRPATQFIKLP